MLQSHRQNSVAPAATIKSATSFAVIGSLALLFCLTCEARNTWNNGVDSAGRRAFHRVNHDQKLHQIVVDRVAVD